ncbi:unnamed protein product [Oikopleura dioica]|uniref:Uncharacterized protein n=1 Tax=Oikopleura dioica TaxID=34765 RepID=E4X7S8_OIKDI|nr:unnamed protein product [Oikopleura dioica]CBY31195.1 unnamed protein product [Oikopleura dioica]
MRMCRSKASRLSSTFNVHKTAFAKLGFGSGATSASFEVFPTRKYQKQSKNICARENRCSSFMPFLPGFLIFTLLNNLPKHFNKQKFYF